MLSTLTLTLSPCSSPHPSDHIPSCHPSLFSSLPLLSCLTITCASTLPLSALAHSFLLVMLFCLLSHFLSPLSPLTSLSFCFPLLFPFLSFIFHPSPPPLLPHFCPSPRFPFSIPLLRFCLWFWAVFTNHIGTGWWSMSFAMITSTHTQTHAYVRAHTDLLGMVVDEQCQTLSIYAHQSSSRNLIRPPGHSMALASILASLPSSLWEEFEVLGLYTSQHRQS